MSGTYDKKLKFTEDKYRPKYKTNAIRVENWASLDRVSSRMARAKLYDRAV